MAASTKTPWEVLDFSGGISDNVFSGETNTGFQMDNFVIGPDRKLESRLGSTLDNAAHSPLPVGNVRIGRLVNYARNDKLFAQTNKDFYYRDDSGAWVKLVGPSGNSVLNAGSPANFVSASEWNKQVFVTGDAFPSPMKIFKDGGGAYKVRNVGLPALASAPTLTPAAGSNSYVYAFIYSCVYTAGTQTFKEVGPPTWVTVAGSAAPNVSAVAITAIPALANSTTDNYDVYNIKIEIYRTINNGTNFYKVGEVMNGTATFGDTMSDTVLQTKVQLYTNDGTLDYYPAPKSKFVHVVGNVGLYGYTKDADGEHPYRVHQSTPGNPGFVPQITWVEVEDEVKGVGSVKGLPIILCKRLVYRVDGLFLASGQGGMNPQKIHHTAGCISNESCVEAENFMFWAGLDGFYATDGYQVTKISDHLNTRYAAMVKAMANPMRIQGRFDEQNRRVIWAVQSDPSSNENDTIFALDLRYGVKPNSTFTTFSGKSFKPTAIEVFNGELHRGDNNGFVFRHGIGLSTDPRVDVSTSATAWAEETIIWNFTTNQYNFGSAFFRKFVSRMLLQAENAGNTTIQVTAINDQGKRTRELKPIRWRRNVTWGDEAISWGNVDCVWSAEGLIEQWRRFPAGGLRLSYLQLKITNALGIITTSDSGGLATLNRATKTIVLPNLWPSKSIDYYLKFANDGYRRMFLVTNINDAKDTLFLQDPLNQLPPSGTYEWELHGYEKGEPLNLIGFTLHWDNVDQNQGTYHRGDDGAN